MKRLILLLLISITFVSFSSATINTTYLFANHNATSSTGSPYDLGLVIYVLKNITLEKVGTFNTDGSTNNIEVKNMSGTPLASSTTAVDSNGNFTITYNLSAGQHYRIEMETEAGTRNVRQGYRKTLPISTSDFIIQEMSKNGANESSDSDLFNPQSITYSYSSPIVYLTSPANGSYATYLNSTFTTPYNITNATLYIWDSSNQVVETRQIVDVSGASNTTSFLPLALNKIENYTWNYLWCDDRSGCVWSESNRTIVYPGLIVLSENYNSSIFELTENPFSINISYNSSRWGSIQGRLYYNNTAYTSSSISSTDNILFIKSITSPLVTTQTNYPFFWSISLINSTDTINFNYTLHNQTVNDITIDNCTANSLAILNFSLFDEVSKEVINGTIETTVTLTSKTSSTNTVNYSIISNNVSKLSICLNSTAANYLDYRLDATTRYQSTDRESEFHHISNLSLTSGVIPQLINLYDLETSRSQSFKIFYKDTNFLPIAGALIDITRKYISEGVFRSVEVPKTDDDGSTTGHFELENAIYTLNVYKEGVLQATFENVVPYCQPDIEQCVINLNAFSSSSSPDDFDTIDGISYEMLFNQTSRVVTTTFSTLDGSSRTFLLNVTRFDNYGNTTLCDDTLTTSAGTLTCTIPSSFGNVSLISSLYANGDFIGQGFYTIQQTPQDVFGGSIVFMLLILFITIPLMALTSGIAVIFLSVLGLIIAGMLNLFEGGTLALGSSVLWFIIAGGILLWKMTQSGNN